MLFYEPTIHSVEQMFKTKPIEIYETAGIKHGIIVKFPKYYLKMYRCPKNEMLIEKYYYHCTEPISSETVSQFYLRNYLQSL